MSDSMNIRTRVTRRSLLKGTLAASVASEHDFPMTGPDERVQRITHNLLRRAIGA